MNPGSARWCKSRLRQKPRQELLCCRHTWLVRPLALFLVTLLVGSVFAVENPTTVIRDPADRLGGSRVLTANGGANVTQWSVTGLGNGPDLDLGFNDYLQLQLKVPAGFNGPVDIDFGTSVKNGLNAADRKISIPGAKLASDGTMHVYRLELGLVPYLPTTVIKNKKF